MRTHTHTHTHKSPIAERDQPIQVQSICCHCWGVSIRGTFFYHQSSRYKIIEDVEILKYQTKQENSISLFLKALANVLSMSDCENPKSENIFSTCSICPKVICTILRQ